MVSWGRLSCLDICHELHTSKLKPHGRPVSPAGPAGWRSAPAGALWRGMAKTAPSMCGAPVGGGEGRVVVVRGRGREGGLRGVLGCVTGKEGARECSLRQAGLRWGGSQRP